MKTKQKQTYMRERFATPKVAKDKSGNIVLLCPFCNPSHPLRADLPTSCGTQVHVQAVQSVFRAKYAPKPITCVKCGKSDGEMVLWQGAAFIHAPDCKPETVTLSEPPRYSHFAKLVYGLPKNAKALIEKFSGDAMKVEEVTPDGERTGVILGYSFKPK